LPGTSVAATSDGGGRFLLVAGTPLREPVARRGPFVMTTEAELDQAFADYQSGHLTDEVSCSLHRAACGGSSGPRADRRHVATA
jgi:hypothetical protein